MVDVLTGIAFIYFIGNNNSILFKKKKKKTESKSRMK